MSKNHNFRHVIEALENNASSKSWSDAISHWHDDKLISISFAQLVIRAKCWGRALSSTVCAGDRVLIILPTGLDFFAAFYACLYLGAIAVPLARPRGPKGTELLSTIIQDAQPAAVISNYQLAAVKASAIAAATATVSQFTVSELDSETEALTPVSLQQYAPVLLQYTSGSTGVPKAVVITNNNLLSNSQAIGQAFQHSSDSQGLSWLPHYHDMGLVGGVVHPLVAGFRTSILCPFKFMQRPSRWLRAISELGVNTTGGPNFAYAECVKRIENNELAGLDISSWDLAFIGAEPVRIDTLNRFAERFSSIGFKKEAFFPCYGLAESTLIVSGGPKGAALHSQKIPSKNLVDSGPPVAGASIFIVDPLTLQMLKEGDEGEVWLQGDSVAAGYWNNSEASRQCFAATLPGDPSPYLRTGDNGYLCDGRLVVSGRINDLIIIRGANFHPEDIERTCLEAYPPLWGTANAAISVDNNNEEKLVIVQEVDTPFDYAAAEKKMKKGIFQVHGIVPHELIFVKQRSLPKTSSGKVKRQKTQSLYYNAELLHVGLG